MAFTGDPTCFLPWSKAMAYVVHSDWRNAVPSKTPHVLAREEPAAVSEHYLGVWWEIHYTQLFRELIWHQDTAAEYSLLGNSESGTNPATYRESGRCILKTRPSFTIYLQCGHSNSNWRRSNNSDPSWSRAYGQISKPDRCQRCYSSAWG